MAPWPTWCKRFHLSSSECVEITGEDQALFHLFLCKSLDERRVLHKDMIIKSVYPSAVLDASGLPMDSSCKQEESAEHDSYAYIRKGALSPLFALGLPPIQP